MHLRVISGVVLLLGSSAIWAGGSDEVASVSCGVQAAIEVGMTPADVKDQCGQNWKPSYVSEQKLTQSQLQVARDIFVHKRVLAKITVC